jgi:hypothetical protein
MRNFYRTLGAALLLWLVSLGAASSAAAQRTYRDSDANIRNLIRRIETRSDTLKQSIDVALDRSRLNGTASEDEINRFISDFENATDRLRERFDNRQSTASDVRVVLEQGAQINRFIVNNRLGNRAEQDWRLLQADLDLLARNYYISDWFWNTGTVGGGTGINLSNAQLRQLARRIDNQASRVGRSLSTEVNRAPINSRDRQEVRRHISAFQTATSSLRNRVDNRSASSGDVQSVLDHAAYIDQFVGSNQLSTRTESDWSSLRTDLNQLASAYNVAWNWDRTPGPGPIYGAGGLTGTYRLNLSQSGNARTAAENATRSLPASRRQRVFDSLMRRFDAPDVLAIEQRGSNVTIVSTRAPQINFVADGREHVETTPNGRTVRVRASLIGDQLRIVRTGERDQDFTVTFDPVSNNRLLVTRQLYADQLSQPVSVQSYYDRTSEVAQLDLYRGPDSVPGSGTVSGDFIVADGTQLVAELNSQLSTEASKENDRFTMRVLSPGQYAGSVIEGYVSNVNRSGRITGRSEMTLNFDTIRMPNGRTYRYAGIVETVRTPGNETVRVDNEGSVRDSDQTNRTVTRTAIGTAVGAIIGAIAGGGKGAAIGAVIGAGTGAGSVYIQGREDLDLPVGTEVTIRTTGPR